MPSLSLSYSNSLFVVFRTAFNTELLLSGLITFSPSSTCSWPSHVISVCPYFVLKMCFSRFNVSWIDGLILCHSWNSSPCKVFYTQSTIGNNIDRWHTINSIHSIRTYIYRSIILVPTILLPFLSSTNFRIVQSLWIIINHWAHQAIPQQAGIIFHGQMTCPVISFPLARCIAIKNVFRLYSGFNFIIFKRHQLYNFWPYLGSIIICECVYSPTNSLSKSSCSKVHLNNNVRMYGSFRHLFLSLELITSSQCLILVEEISYWIRDGMISFQFDTQWITIMNVPFGNSWRQPVVCSPASCSRSNVYYLLPCLHLFYASHVLLA